MHDIAASNPGCVREPIFDPKVCGFSSVDEVNCIPLNGCGSDAIFPIMLLYIMITPMVFVKLIVGVVVDGFEDFEKTDSSISLEELFSFNKIWLKFDPRATQLLPQSKIKDLIRDLPGTFVSTNLLLINFSL